MSELTDMRQARVAEQGEIIAKLRKALVEIREVAGSDWSMVDHGYVKNWIHEAVGLALGETAHGTRGGSR